MRRLDKERLKRRSGLREYLPKPSSNSDVPAKLIFVALFILGVIFVWSKQDTIAQFAETTALLSPIATFVMEHIFGVYLAVAGILLTILILAPLGKRAAQDQLRSIGLVNHTDMVPALKRRYKDKENPQISVWEFSSQGIPLKTWEDKQAAIETIFSTVPCNKPLPTIISATIQRMLANCQR